MLGKRREGAIRMRGRREEWRSCPGRSRRRRRDGRGCEEARGKMRWRKDKEERERAWGWLASAKTRPLYHQRRTADRIDTSDSSFLPSFLSAFLPSSFFPLFFYRMRFTMYVSGVSTAGLILSKHRTQLDIQLQSKNYNCSRQSLGKWILYY